MTRMVFVHLCAIVTGSLQLSAPALHSCLGASLGLTDEAMRGFEKTDESFCQKTVDEAQKDGSLSSCREPPTLLLTGTAAQRR